MSTRLQNLRIAPSVGRTGTALANAAMETTIGLHKTELIRTRRWASRQQIETATSAWVTWFNERRLPSTLDYQNPTSYEKRYHQQQAQPRRATQNQSLYKTQGASMPSNSGANTRDNHSFTVARPP